MTARWWSKDTVALVTGSNKGIGYEIVRGLAKNGVTTVLTARDPGRGQKAVDALIAEGLDSVVFHTLDVCDASSAEELAAWVKSTFGGLDILINNAAIGVQGKPDYDAAREALATNYYGVKTVTNTLLTLLRPGARIVNVSSQLGQLSFLTGESLRKKLGDVEHLTEEVVDAYAVKYVEDSKAGVRKEEGWCTVVPHYSDSKVLLNAYTRAFAKTLSSKYKEKKISVNLVHPGYIATDINNNSGPGSPEEGADTEVWLALLPEENYPNGEFFFEREHLAW